jgi:hypothetical protein
MAVELTVWLHCTQVGSGCLQKWPNSIVSSGNPMGVVAAELMHSNSLEPGLSVGGGLAFEDLAVELEDEEGTE